MILELKDIELGFSNARGEVFDLLAGVDMSVRKGMVTALIGGNGAGKTTLFNIISGFEKGYRGHVFFEGREIGGMSPHRIARLGIGRLFQGRQLMEDLTLMENLKIASVDTSFELPFDSIFRGRRIRESESAREQQAVDLLKRVLGEDNKYLRMLDTKASSLSFGEQRLIALVRLLMDDDRLLMRERRLLLLDEPTSGINPKYTESFRSVIREMVEKEGLTVLMIEHNMGFVRSVADECHYLASGRIIRKGSVSEVLDDPVIRKDYMGL